VFINNMIVGDVMRSETGSIVVSVILGLGLATVFRRACSGGACIVVKGPPVKEISNNTYKINDDCWRYTPYVTRCEEDSMQSM
jgi:hypothetical protein